MSYTIGDLIEAQLGKKLPKEESIKNFHNTNMEEVEFIQGDIWLANLEKKAMGHEQGGRRPVLIISNTEWNKHSKTPICVICTTSEKKGKNRYTVDLKRDNSDVKHTYANGSQVYTLDSGRMLRKVDSISKRKLKYIKKIVIDLLRFD